MKVLQINSVCGVGSTGRIATDLYKVLEEEGHECLIAYGRGTAPEGIKSIKIGTDFDNYMHVAKTRIFDKHGFGSQKATKKFIEKVKEYDPDVIHLHNIHGYYINIEILFRYLKEARKKVIWTLHDCWAFTGHCAYFDFVDCKKWKEGCRRCPQKLSYPKSIFIDNSRVNHNIKKKVLCELDKNQLIIITPSRWLAGLVNESYLRKYKVQVINNGIDLDLFKATKSKFREKYCIYDKKMILGVASYWDKRKGLDYFVKISKELDENFQVVIVGVDEKQKKELPNNIISITRTENINDLVEIYSTADIFLNPTLEDNFPTTNLEALACGTQVWTFNTGGSTECLENNMFLGKILKKDIKSIVEELKNHESIDISKKFDIRNYSKYSMGLKYLDLYSEIKNE